jgi:transcription antitermination factor NusG
VPDTELSDCYIARTQAYRERWAAENCLREGHGFYLPEVTETVRILRRGKRTREFRNKPLFPGYLFVSVETGRWHTLMRTFGVIGLVLSAGGNPAIIKAHELRRIKAFEGGDGKVHLPKKGFRHGDTARITAGAYAGFNGLVQGLSPGERIAMLLDYMGRKVPFLVRESDLELVSRAA